MSYIYNAYKNDTREEIEPGSEITDTDGQTWKLDAVTCWRIYVSRPGERRDSV